MTSHIVISNKRGRRRSRTLPTPQSVTWVEELPSPPPRYSHAVPSPPPLPTIAPRPPVGVISRSARNSPLAGQHDPPARPGAHHGGAHRPPFDDRHPPAHTLGVIAGALVCAGGLASLVAAADALLRVQSRGAVIWCVMSALGFFSGLYAFLCLCCGRGKRCPGILVRWRRRRRRPARAKELERENVEGGVRRW